MLLIIKNRRNDKFTAMVSKLRRSLSQELDFRNEARNCRQLAQCMAGNAGVTAPRVVGELSGKRVLCMEWVDGCKVGQATCRELRHDLRPLVAEASFG